MDEKSVYIHIPFCENICTYCDFTKQYYNASLVNTYLESLAQEMKRHYKNEPVKTIYIGGGTPSSLTTKEISRLLEALKLFNLNSNIEFTFECNIENITEDKLKLLKKYGVNRISIGVQTINPKFIDFLGRKHTKEEVKEKITNIKQLIPSINVDLMYAFPNQTKEDLKKDLEFLLKLDIDHISTYSLMIEPHTILYIKNTKSIDEDLDRKMYDLIRNTLEKNGFAQYETSNFAKPNKESKHNLTYWNNEEYYGFGLGAAGYIDDTRYTNVLNIRKYNDGIYKDDVQTLSKQEMIENEWILGLRKIEGINIETFKRKFNKNPINETIIKLIEEGKLIKDKDNIYINKKYIYIANTILVDLIGIKYE